MRVHAILYGKCVCTQTCQRNASARINVHRAGSTSFCMPRHCSSLWSDAARHRRDKWKTYHKFSDFVMEKASTHFIVIESPRNTKTKEKIKFIVDYWDSARPQPNLSEASAWAISFFEPLRASARRCFSLSRKQSYRLRCERVGEIQYRILSSADQRQQSIVWVGIPGALWV